MKEMKTVIFFNVNSIEPTALANKVLVMSFISFIIFLSIFLTVIICCQKKKLKRRDLQFQDDNPEGASSSELKTQPSPSSAMENQSVIALATLRGIKNLKMSESVTSNSGKKHNVEESSDDLGTLRDIYTKPVSKHQRAVDQGKGEPTDVNKVEKISKLKFQVKEQSKMKQQSELKVAERPVVKEMQNDQDKKVPQQAYATTIGVENRMLPPVRKDKANIIEPAKRVDTNVEPIKKVDTFAHGMMIFIPKRLESSKKEEKYKKPRRNFEYDSDGVRKLTIDKAPLKTAAYESFGMHRSVANKEHTKRIGYESFGSSFLK